MKARVMYKLTEEAKYKLFVENAEDLTREIIAALMLAIHMKMCDAPYEERKKKVIEIFDDIQSILKMPSVCGKLMTGTEVMSFITREYGINFDQVNPKVEVEDEYHIRMNKTED